MSRLEERLRGSGFSPQREDAAELFALLAGDDRERCRVAERALTRAAEWSAEETLTRLQHAAPPLRGRLTRLLGRIAGRSQQTSLISALLALLDDADGKTRRSAIIALGKLGLAEAGASSSGPIEQRLLARWAQRPDLIEQRGLVAALGKVGGAAALAVLRVEGSEDAELSRLLQEARLKIERTLGRADPGRIDPRRIAPQAVRVRFHCRSGLEQVLADELGQNLPLRARRRACVEVCLATSLERLQNVRTALRFGFPLPSRALRPGEELAAGVADALTAPASRTLLRAFTVGPIRFRLEWAGAGHRRAQSFRVAAAVAQRWPELRNDPTRSQWEVIVREHRERRRVELELWPRGLPDPRFAYRRREVPASSHPTVAAALARVAGVRADDVCWDPFVGSGLELCERGLLGAYASLIGSDVDAAALQAATENLAAAGLPRCELAIGDALTYRPSARPSLIITNPPMGRRLLRGGQVEPLLEGFLKHAAELLLTSGRLVWMNPLPEGGLAALRAAGLQPELRQRVDMGGFHAELQVLRQAPR